MAVSDFYIKKGPRIYCVRSRGYKVTVLLDAVLSLSNLICSYCIYSIIVKQDLEISRWAC